jgi:hypothetical protein
MVNTNPEVWKIETLVSKAFERTKQRFLSYLFVYVIGILIAIAAAAVIAVSAVLLFFLFKTANLPALTIFLGVVLAVSVIGALIYLGSWIQLTVLSVITDDKKMSVNEALKKTRPLVPGFIVLALLNGLFIAGLLPFGILSLFIIFILWAIWGAFTGLVYLYQKQPRGLNSLWLSRQMVDQNFWGIVGRLILVGAVIYFFLFLFTFSGNSFLRSLSPIVSLVVTPFIIAFLYEMYKNLTVPKTVTTPTVWITLSVIGWVLLLIVIAAFGGVVSALWGQVMPYKLPIY